MMKNIDDYDLYDLDFEEWARRGRVAFGLEADRENQGGTAASEECQRDECRL